ncbi:hypothetical protein [Amycolatopsis nalaikhensis]|uniref:4Fe-4S ferredoxin-type domain-containing protein n=1 Tax=Amycolatopsis nalaikhensis TaxID=715472 RepID=A0ABY8XQE5_9PSEU|nr:hypothetical protein [Amycolatopsis sp. 2-2]WIV57846.1 hypothetical protein QP939_03945 [Amycolatopsis sp. 2-2]
MPATTRSYLAFMPHHTSNTHMVLAMVDRGDGPEAETLVSLPEALSATMLASALNGVLLHQVAAERHLAAVLNDAPDPVRVAVAALLPTLIEAATEDPAAARVVRHLPVAGDRGFLLFPTTNCPGRCEFCGTCRDDCVACPECADGGCEICLPVTLTPRTAAVLGHALAVLADEAYDYVYRTGLCRGGEPGPLGAVPTCVASLDEWFLRRYARSFDDLSSDLQVGRHPTPACTAEEIALDLAIRDAERLYHDEDELISDLETELPASRSDYNWDTLQDVLFQDKDYEGLLGFPEALSPREAEQLFDQFGNTAPRDRHRGFRR